MSDLNDVIRGRVWKFGDSIDTNQLAGGGLPGKDYEDTLRINCLRGLRPDFTEAVRPGDIVVAGSNFGCGSSRQSAVEALQLCGISVVLADSVARIHRRNSIALGLPTFAVAGVSAIVDEGDEVEVNYPEKLFRNLSRGHLSALHALPSSVEEIYQAGGLVQVIARRLAERGIVPGPG